MVLKIPKEAYNYKMEFKDFQDWFIGFKNPSKVWDETPTHLLIEVMYYFGGLICFLHAFRRGGRWPWICFAAIGHGIFVEVVSYYVPDIDNFWHSQSMITLIGRRLPLHILFLYVVFYYHAFWAASKLKLKCPYSQHIAVGLLGVLMDIPYDITGIRFLNWTWHDTDPNIYERSYFVPWTSYLFHFTFSSSMSLIFHKSRGIFEKRNLDKWQGGSLLSELFAVFLTSVCSMPLGAIMFTLTYHPLHDLLLVPTETVVMSVFAILILFVWKFDRVASSSRTEVNKTVGEKRTITEKLLYVYLVVHYLSFIAMNISFSPEQHISTTFHEPIGDCNKMKSVKTILKDLQKREFLCVTDYDEKYFDFSCLKEVPPAGSTWYTVCGTAYENRAEYIWILSVIAFAALIIFTSIHYEKKESVAVKLPSKSKKDKAKTK